MTVYDAEGKQEEPEATNNDIGITGVEIGQDDVGGDQLRENEGSRTEERSFGNKLFAKHLITSFRPIRILLLVFGRLPLQCTCTSDGTYVFSSSWLHPYGLYFLFTSIITFYIFVIGTWNIFIVLMDVDILGTGSKEGKLGREYEKIVIERHLVTFIVIYTALIHSVVASIVIICKRDYLVNYFVFWTRSVDTMHMDIAKGTFRQSLISCGLFILMMFILAILAGCRVGPSTTGGPTILAIMMFRLYLPKDWLYYVTESHSPNSSHTGRTILQLIGGLFLIYVFVASKAYIFVFLYKCKLLRNAFANWNGRVYAAVLRGGDFTQTEEGRTTYSLLFKDHCILLDLMEGTDRLFSCTIESYFGLQICSICFEIYFFLRTAKYGNKGNEGALLGTFFGRPNDWAPGLIILLQSLLILLVVSKAAADVGEEAMAGLEVIRRKTMLGRKTDEELYFMLSMFSSYTAYKRLEISGGGYFYLNKEFIIGLISTIFSYFIILYQFQPTLDHSTVLKPQERRRIGEFLSNLESLEPDHWKPGNSRTG